MTTLTQEQTEASEILIRARKLPPELREQIASELLAEFETTEERAALKAELTRRWERLRSGDEKTHTIDEVLSDLFRRAEEFKKS